MTLADFQSPSAHHPASPFHTHPPHDDRRAALLRWLADFANAVRHRDYAHARTLFHPDVFSFGTRTSIMHSLDALVENQWRPTWEVTAGYQFLMDQVHFEVQDDLAWIAAPFVSRQRESISPELHRTGRATYVLRWDSSTTLNESAGRWLAVHSHHSLDPSRHPSS